MKWELDDVVIEFDVHRWYTIVRARRFDETEKWHECVIHSGEGDGVMIFDSVAEMEGEMW